MDGAGMIPRKSQILCLWYGVWDLTMTALAWTGAFYLRVESGLMPLIKTPPTWGQCLGNLPMVLILSMVAYRITGQYAIHRFRRLREEFLSVGKGVALMGLFVIAGTFSLHDDYESRLVMVLFMGLAGVLILTARRVTWAIIH